MKKWHIFLLGFLVVFDQFTKFYIDANFELYESVSIIPGFFSFTYTHNTGAAWSILEGKMLFFYSISIVALVVMGYFYKQTKEFERLTRLGLVFMIAGTFGNLIDRICYQYVRDFLDFIIFGYDFPIFNIADTVLCIGVVLILLEVAYEELVKYGIIKVNNYGN